MVYPILRPQVSEDDLIAHFTLDLEEQEIVRRIGFCCTSQDLSFPWLSPSPQE